MCQGGQLAYVLWASDMLCGVSFSDDVDDFLPLYEITENMSRHARAYVDNLT